MWCNLLICLTVNTRLDVTISHQTLGTPRVKVLPCLIWVLSVSRLPEAILYHQLHLASGWEVGKWHFARMFSRELGSIFFLEDKDHLLASTNILYDIKAHHLNWKSEQHRWCKRQTVLSLWRTVICYDICEDWANSSFIVTLICCITWKLYSPISRFLEKILCLCTISLQWIYFKLKNSS